MSPAPLPASILFENADHTVVVIDIPRSIEEAQERQVTQDTQNPFASGYGLSSQTTRRRLASVPALTEPFETPRPRSREARHDAGQSLASQLAELTAQATVERALCELQDSGFDGPWCLPRHISQEATAEAAEAAEVAEAGMTAHGDKASLFIPPEARYLNGTIADCRNAFVADAPHFDLIVLDPPWPNRSARRRRQGRKRKSSVLDDRPSADRGYDTASDMDALRETLEQIPLGSKLADGAIVAVWVTNKPSCEALLTDPRCGVFRAWGVELAATWTWLKVTAKGQPIVSVESHWRRPWERLLLARRPGANKDGNKAGAKALPAHRVIVGVPDVHSRKPHLRPLLAPFLAPAVSSSESHTSVERPIRGLEVFARNLTAGWWSWGNEVLLFQHPSWWSVDEKDEGVETDDSVQVQGPMS